MCWAKQPEEESRQDGFLQPPKRRSGIADWVAVKADDNIQHDIEKLCESGQAQEAIEELLDQFLVAKSDNDNEQRAKLWKRLEAVDIPKFCRYWLPGGDLQSILALAALAASGWIADDLFDQASNQAGKEKEDAAKKIVAKAWLELPELVQKVWQESDGAPINHCSLDQYLEEVRSMYHTTSPGKALPMVLQAHQDLLTYSLISLRLKCGENDDQYLFFGKEMKRWMQNNIQKQNGKNTLDTKSSLEQLEEFREIDGGFKFVLVFCLAVAGIQVDSSAYDLPQVHSLVRSSGLHLAFLNDIFSYEKDTREEVGANANLVEYLRIHQNCNTLEEALESAIRIINRYVQEFDATASTLLKGFDNKQHESVAAIQVIIDTCIQQMTGNVHWSLQNNRYSFREFIAERCSLW
jgi:hypothetical protein